MRIGAIATALVSVFMLAALAFAGGEHTSNKWRIELDGSALKTGDMQFRVTPSQGESVDVDRHHQERTRGRRRGEGCA